MKLIYPLANRINNFFPSQMTLTSILQNIAANCVCLAHRVLGRLLKITSNLNLKKISFKNYFVRGKLTFLTEGTIWADQRKKMPLKLFQPIKLDGIV